MIARECLEIVNEMRLVVVPTFIGDFGERFLLVPIFIECGMKPDNPAEQLRCESGECQKFPFKLPGRQKTLCRQVRDFGQAIGPDHTPDHREYCRLTDLAAANTFSEEFGDNMDALRVVGGEHDTLFKLGTCLAQECSEVGHLVTQFCCRDAKQRRNGERVEVHAQNPEVLPDTEPAERLRLPVNARPEGKLLLVGFQYFIETTFEMKNHFGAAIGHGPVEIGLAISQVVFQHPEEADVSCEVGRGKYGEIFHALTYLVYLF